MPREVDWAKLTQHAGSGCGATFFAMYSGTCPECGGEIYEGDRVGYVDDEVVCADGPDSCYELALNS